MSKRVRVAVVVMLLYAAATQVYLAFWFNDEFQPWSLVAAIACVASAVVVVRTS